MSACTSSYKGMGCVFFSISAVLHSNCATTSNKMTIYHCRWCPTAFLSIFWTCSHLPDLFQPPYNTSSTGKPSYHLRVTSRYLGEEPKQNMWASFTRIMSTPHLYVGILLGFQFYGDVRRKKSTWDNLPPTQPLITSHARKAGTSDQRGLQAACLTQPTPPTANLPRISTSMGHQGRAEVNSISPLRKQVPLRAKICWPCSSPLRA